MVKVWCILALSLTNPAIARMEFMATRGDERLAGAQICFAPSGGPGVDALTYHFGNPVECVSADHVLDIPPGRWSYFLWHESGYVNSHRGHLKYDSAPENSYRGVKATMEEAGLIDFTQVTVDLDHGERIYVLTAPSVNRHLHIIPLLPDETVSYVPANTIAVPLVVDKNSPVRVGRPVTVQHTELHRYPSFNRQRTLIVTFWLPEKDRDISYQAATRTTLPPTVEVTTAAGDTVKPYFELVHGFDLTEALLIFPLGEEVHSATISLHGSGWKPASQRVTTDGALNLATIQITPISSDASNE